MEEDFRAGGLAIGLFAFPWDEADFEACVVELEAGVSAAGIDPKSAIILEEHSQLSEVHGGPCSAGSRR